MKLETLTDEITQILDHGKRYEKLLSWILTENEKLNKQCTQSSHKCNENKQNNISHTNKIIKKVLKLIILNIKPYVKKIVNNM